MGNWPGLGFDPALDTLSRLGISAAQRPSVPLEIGFVSCPLYTLYGATDFSTNFPTRGLPPFVLLGGGERDGGGKKRLAVRNCVPVQTQVLVAISRL